MYIQDSITKKNWTFNIGLRGELYNGITSASQVEPRLGIAYNIKPTNIVLRVSYARTFETPFNENLVLASLGCNDAVVNAIMSALGPCSTSPLTPGWRNEFHVGLQQAFGRYLVIDAEYIWKYTHLAYDFSVLGNTPITFPVEWHNSKIPGYAVRASVPNFHGFTAFVVFSGVAARFFTPQISGIGSAPGGSSVFRIDHDELFNQTTHLQYQPWKRGPWFSFNWRYDSGLVAGPVPCAGGNCANGPNGTDSIVDVTGLTPDQQFQASLFCGSVRATPTMPISPDGLCPAAQYGSSLVKVSRGGHRGRRSQSAAHRITESVRYRCRARQFVSRRQTQGQRPCLRREPDESIRALQLPLDLQWHPLRFAANGDCDSWIPLLRIHAHRS